MRISDWSSDVCSSDLHALRSAASRRRRGQRAGIAHPDRARRPADDAPGPLTDARRAWRRGSRRSRLELGPLRGSGAGPRSEEHTSELQSLMRISYAVFCLKKKIQYNIKSNDNTNINV